MHGCLASQKGIATKIQKTGESQPIERWRSWTTMREDKNFVQLVSSTRLCSWLQGWAHCDRQHLLKLVEQLFCDNDGDSDGCLVRLYLGFIYNRV